MWLHAKVSIGFAVRKAVISSRVQPSYTKGIVGDLYHIFRFSHRLHRSLDKAFGSRRFPTFIVQEHKGVGLRCRLWRSGAIRYGQIWSQDT